jgi:hypothetical protein
MRSSGSISPRSIAMLKQMPVTPLATLIMQTVECSSHSCERSARAQPPHRSTTVSPVEHHRSAGAELVLAGEVLDESRHHGRESFVVAPAQRVLGAAGR